MSLRDPNSGNKPPMGAFPIANGFAAVILVALVLLFAMRHLFGAVRVEAGVR